MKIPDEVRKGVVFLGFKNREGIHQLAGTGFFVTRRVGPPGNYFVKSTGRGYTYLVTAKHVIDGIRGENADRCVFV